MKHQTSELTGALLDAAVAKASGTQFKVTRDEKHDMTLVMALDAEERPWFPSKVWGHGGPIIERERINIEYGSNQEAFPGWTAIIGPVHYGQEHDAIGPTPLIAAMRAYVASRLGPEVEL